MHLQNSQVYMMLGILQRHPDYVSPGADLHLHPPILNKEEHPRISSECFIGIGKFTSYEYHIKIEEKASSLSR